MALTYYEVLGVPENATNAEIEAAFKSKAREVHPDKVGSGSPYLQKVAAEAFKELSEARSVLLDPAKRQKYDSALAYMRGSAASSATSAPQPPPPPPRHSTPSGTAPPQSGSPPPQPQQSQKQSFWKPTNTGYGAVAVSVGGLGIFLCLQGLIEGLPRLSFGLALVFTSLGLLSWRHGTRPGTDPKVLGGSVFLFIFAVAFMAGWLESSPTTPTLNTTEPNKSAAPAPAATSPPATFIPYASATTGTSKHSSGVKDSTPSTARPKVDQLSPSEEKDNRTEKADLSNGPPPVSSGSPVSARTVPSNGRTLWKSLTDGQLYRTQFAGANLELELAGAPGQHNGDIVHCDFHQAISVGLSWIGACSVRNPKDGSVYSSEGYINTFSATRVEGRTTFIPKFILVPAEEGATPDSGVSGSDGRSNASGDKTRTIISPPPNPWPDTSTLSSDEKLSIELACVTAKTEGPASYNRCLSRELAALASAPPHPDLSRLGSDEKLSIELACITAKTEGPALYNRCLSRELAGLASAPPHPDLSRLSSDEKLSIELACVTAKTEGPASYNRCLVDQLNELDRH